MKLMSFIVLAGALCASSAQAQSEGAINAEWCLKRATKLIKDQPMLSECPKYVPKYGLRHQNDLAREAGQEACAGHDDRAIELLQICQCHNNNASNSLSRDKESVISWLKGEFCKR